MTVGPASLDRAEGSIRELAFKGVEPSPSPLALFCHFPHNPVPFLSLMGVNALKILRGSSLFVVPFPPSSRDYVALTAAIQRFHGPQQVKYWGCPDPCDPRGVDAYAFSASVARWSGHHTFLWS